MKRQFYVTVFFFIGILPNAFSQNIPNDGIISDIMGGIQVGNLPEGLLNSDALIYGYSQKMFVKGYYIGTDKIKHDGYLQCRNDENWGGFLISFKKTNSEEEKAQKIKVKDAIVVKSGADSLISFTYTFDDEKITKFVRYIGENENYLFFNDGDLPPSHNYAVSKKTNSGKRLVFDTDRIKESSYNEFFKVYISQSPIVEKRILAGKYNWSKTDQILPFVEKIEAFEKKKVFYYDTFWNELKGDTSGFEYKMSYENLTQNEIDAIFYTKENMVIQTIVYTGDYLTRKSLLKCYDNEKVLFKKYFNSEENVDSIVTFYPNGKKELIYRNLTGEVKVFKVFDENEVDVKGKRSEETNRDIVLNGVEYHNNYMGHLLKSSFYINKNGQKVYRYLQSGFRISNSEKLLNKLDEIIDYTEDELNDNNDYVLKLKVLISANKEILKIEYLDSIPESYKLKVPKILKFITENMKGELPNPSDLYETLIPICFIKNQLKKSIHKSPFFQPYPYDYWFYMQMYHHNMNNYNFHQMQMNIPKVPTGGYRGF